MSTKQENDIQTLKTDVALIKLEQVTQGKALVEINSKLDNLAFVPQKDHDRDMKNVQDQLDAMNKRLEPIESQVNAGGLKVANALNSGVSKAIIAVVVVAILAAIVLYIPRLFPAVGAS